MQDVDRGKIRNRAVASQLRDFSGLRWGKITPTDFDGVIDFQNRIFIFIETKYGGTGLPTGQRLALARVCDAVQASGKEAIVFITEHNSSGDIIMSESIVTEYRYLGDWHLSPEPIPLKEAIDGFLATMEKGYQ